jgi:saccharopine dehydrogenase-like NADP-dependent oxidoreductase
LVSGIEVSPRDVLLALLPPPKDLAGKVEGHAMIVVEVEGTQRGERVEYKLWTTLSHAEAHRRCGATATAYLTGTGTGICATMFARGKMPGSGVVAAECLDSQVFMSLMREKGIPAREQISVLRDPLVGLAS